MHDLAAQPLLTAEFLAVDTETNGLGKDLCELTEVGAVLVGGGELHERWGSLVGVAQPLSRGIQRFTGISQAMVDAAPPPERGAARAGGADARTRARRAQRRASTRACCARPSTARRSTWPDPPILCTVALARRVAPLQRRRGLAALADALGIEVEGVAPRAARRGDLRARVLRAVLEAVGERRDDRRGGRAAERAARRRARGRARRRPSARATPGPTSRACRRTPASTCSATPTDVRCTSASRSACGPGHARTSRRRASGPAQAEHVDYQATHSELGALVLENRLIKALKPPGNKRLKKTPDGYVYLRCRFDIPFPILEVAREPAAGHSVDRRAAARARRRGRAGRAAQLAVRAAPLRAHAAAPRPSLGLRADGPLPVAVPARPRPQPLPRAPRRGARAASPARRTARRRCSTTSSARCGRPRPSAATSARPGCAAATRGCARCSPASAACCARSTPARGSCSRRTRATRARHDAFWVVGGRVVDWGPLPDDPAELASRTADALRAAPRPEHGGWLRPEEIAEARIVGLWLAAHDDARVRELRPGAEDAGALAAWVSGSAARAA